MPIIGIGTDIVEIERIKSSTEGGFLKRVYTESEIKLIDERGDVRGVQTAAANFAAKEAFVKALGSGFNGIAPNEVETLRDKNGKPFINLYGRAREKAELLGVEKIHVSLSHSKETATAFVVLE